MYTETEQIAEIYKVYPRRVAKIAALKAIQKAVTFLVHSEKITSLEARRKLYRATLQYARSLDGQNPDRTLIPHPATWYNRGSYLDDPKEWQHGGTNGTTQGSPANKWDRLRAEIDRETLGEETPRHDG